MKLNIFHFQLCISASRLGGRGAEIPSSILQDGSVRTRNGCERTVYEERPALCIRPLCHRLTVLFFFFDSRFCYFGVVSVLILQ